MFSFGHSMLASLMIASAWLQAAEAPLIPKEMGGKYFGAVPDPKWTKRYYIAAEPVVWNYLPLRTDPTCSATGAELFQRMPALRTVLERPSSQKIRYVQYTDENFNVRAEAPERLGILGPVLRGVVGQYLAVTFLNRADRPLSMHPHGVKYDKDSEGAAYLPNMGSGAAISPGGRFTYVWKLDENSGPLPDEPSSKAWLYHSHVVSEEEINLGLVGFIVVTDPKRARPDGTPSDVDREMPALFTIFNESLLEDDHGAPDILKKDVPRDVLVLRLAEGVRALKVQEENERHTLNGLSFANLKGLEMQAGERVRWYLFSVGSERDSHSIHWHGSTVVENGRRRTDVIELMPASMKVADMVADNPGTWLIQCHVGEHMMHGMYSTYTIMPKSGDRRLQEPFLSASDVPDSILIRSVENSAEAVTFNGEFGLANQPIFDGAVVELNVGGSRSRYTLNSSGRGEDNGNRVAFRLARTGGGSLGVTVGFTCTLNEKLNLASNQAVAVSVSLNKVFARGHIFFPDSPPGKR